MSRPSTTIHLLPPCAAALLLLAFLLLGAATPLAAASPPPPLPVPAGALEDPPREPIDEWDEAQTPPQGVAAAALGTEPRARARRGVLALGRRLLELLRWSGAAAR